MTLGNIPHKDKRTRSMQIVLSSMDYTAQAANSSGIHGNCLKK
jgi:hypothetical protein